MPAMDQIRTVSVFKVTADGWEKVSGDDTMDLHYKYAQEPRKL